ncbi:hypothetical protein [Pseudoalteromonas mariniglutinosa]|uniref:hypothetical protein n=1 Tax=Pseudoalteromonas mariniglutinosa TaxID=206042 RepID=UPI00384BE96C
MEFKNNYGTVSITVEDNIIIAEFSGNLNISLVNAFADSLHHYLTPLSGEPWCYIANCSTLLAATPEAEAGFTSLVKKVKEQNCIASAYIFSSALVFNQMKRILAKAESQVQLLDCLFNDVDSAKNYVTNQLNLAKVAQ